MSIFLLNVLGRRTPPFFCSPPDEEELQRIHRQMEGHRFDPSLVLGVASRCRFGYTQTIVCAPISGLRPATLQASDRSQSPSTEIPLPSRRPQDRLQDLRVFPTTFWLVCPWLSRRAGAVEAAGGVRRLEAWLSEHDREGWQEYNRQHRAIRLSLVNPTRRVFLRLSRPGLWRALKTGGVGGIRPGEDIRVKCLHLQTASWLALSRHPGQEWLVEAGLDGDCGGNMAGLCCGS